MHFRAKFIEKFRFPGLEMQLFNRGKRQTGATRIVAVAYLATGALLLLSSHQARRKQPPRLQIRTAEWRYTFYFSVFPGNLLRPGDVNVKGL
jgi:hypothetical protein